MKRTRWNFWLLGLFLTLTVVQLFVQAPFVRADDAETVQESQSMQAVQSEQIPDSQSVQTQEPSKKDAAVCAPESFLVVSSSGFETFFNAVRMISETSVNPSFEALIKGGIQSFFGSKFMETAKADMEISLVFQHFPKPEGGEEIFSMAALPVGDAEVVLRSFLAKDEEVDFTKREDGVIQWNDRFLKALNGWTYLCQDERQLAQLTGDFRLDPEFTPDGVLCMHFRPSAIPAGMRTKYLKAIQDGIDLALVRNEKESEEQFAERTENAQKQLKELEDSWESLKTISLEMQADEPNRALRLRLKISALPETEFAKTLQRMAKNTSKFAGFSRVPGILCGYEAQTVSVDLEIAESEISKFFEKVREIRKEKKSLMKYEAEIQEIESVFKLVLEELAGKTSKQLGYAFTGNQGNLNFLMGISLDRQKELKAGVRKSVELFQKIYGKEKCGIQIRKDVKLTEGVVCDEISISAEDLVRLLTELLGEEAEIQELSEIQTLPGERVFLILASEKDALYVGLGNSPSAELTKRLPLALPSESWFEIRMDLKQTLQFAGAFLEKMSDALQKRKTQLKADSAGTENAEIDEETKMEVSGKDTSDSTLDSEGFESEDELFEEEEDELSGETSEEKQLAFYLEESRKNIRELEKYQRLLKDTKESEIILSCKVKENVFEAEVYLEEGITKILGMLPNLLLSGQIPLQ